MHMFDCKAVYFIDSSQLYKQSPKHKHKVALLGQNVA